MDRPLRRSARSQGRRGRLGRAHSVLGDPQLRAAGDGEPAGLSRPVRRRDAAADRGRSAPRRGGIDFVKILRHGQTRYTTILQMVVASDVDEIDYIWINPLEDLEIVPTHDLCANLSRPVSCDAI